MLSEQSETLKFIGFSQIEAEIYILLLKESNLTGYRLSRLVVKPKSTVYKALDALQKKGAVVADEAAKIKEFSAVPYQEFFKMKEREFSQNRQQAEEILKSIKSGPVKPGLYPLEKIDQVFNKCLEIIIRAKKTILVACCHLENGEVIKALEQAAAKGIKVSVDCHLPVPKINGADFTFNESSQYRVADFEHNWLEIFVDGKEYVISLMSKDASILYRAVWCNEQYLSVITFNSNVYAMVLTRVRQFLHEDRSKQEIKEMIDARISDYYECLGEYIEK
ncbi:MAG: hypothetical protein JW996_04875 [Candidatus Cloacimonetes bacterium]|nr:hypothetical protein [Candidatus Cloacimonadota bacterium]